MKRADRKRFRTGIACLFTTLVATAVHAQSVAIPTAPQATTRSTGQRRIRSSSTARRVCFRARFARSNARRYPRPTQSRECCRPGASPTGRGSIDEGGWLVTGSLTATLGYFKFWNNAFDVPPSSAAATYRRDPGWGEFFVEPGIAAQYTVNSALRFYGGAAYMETGTRGTDYAGLSSTTHGDREQLYAGIKLGSAGDGPLLDVSYGQQNFVVGESLLIASGATNGPQRGADYLGPRAAWANAALAKLTWHGVEVSGFYLKPNEATALATGTRLAGVDVDWEGTGPLRGGAMYLRVTESDIVTRDGLDVFDLRGRLHPLPDAPNFWLEGEYVWQRKSAVRASGWYLQLNYNAKDAHWKPLVTLQYASFSGDRPETATWEGFDPLYYGGSNPNWFQGKLGSTLFGNTNLDSISATLTLAPSEKTILQFVYLNFAANEKNAPLVIPAAGRPPPIGGGVPARALANEVDAVFTYTFNHNVNANAFVAYAAPGSGYKQLYANEGGRARDWWGVGFQLNVSY